MVVNILDILNVLEDKGNGVSFLRRILTTVCAHIFKYKTRICLGQDRDFTSH